MLGNYINNFMFITIILIKWGLGIGDWGLGKITNPQSPIPSKKIGEIYINLSSLIPIYLLIINS